MHTIENLNHHSKKRDSENRIQVVNKGRDYSIYTWRMDAAKHAKVQSLVENFIPVRDGMVIVDAGSGTGLVAQEIAEYFHRLGIHVTVIALDISHEYYETSSLHPTIELTFGDAADQVFPDESIHIKYYSTSGHEIASFGGGTARMETALKNSFRELKPGGQILIRDFVMPSQTEPVYMELPLDDGATSVPDPDHIDYTKLSTFTLFQRFHQEFGGGNAFTYELVSVQGKTLIKLTPEWAYEFYMRKEYRGNWRNEIHEKYSYWSFETAKEALQAAGFEQIQAMPTSSQYMLDNWLRGKVQLYNYDEAQGQLQPLDFPATHMVITGIKPEINVNSNQEESKAQPIDFLEVTDSIQVDLEQGEIIFKPWKKDHSGTVTSTEIKFAIEKMQPLKGKKFLVYKLLGEDRVIKIPNPEYVTGTQLNAFQAFRALQQRIDRQEILEKYETNHLDVLDYDQDGPPYRFIIQEALPENAQSMADLILNQTVSEEDIQAICDQINKYETDKEFQLDSNPFAWFKVPKPDGGYELVYASGKVYTYHEDWAFSKIGLLQWVNPKYLSEASYFFAAIPNRKEQLDFAQEWHASQNFTAWKKYLTNWPVVETLERPE